MIVKNVPHKANSVITARKIWWPRPRYSVSTRMWDGNYSIMKVSVKVSKKKSWFPPRIEPMFSGHSISVFTVPPNS